MKRLNEVSSMKEHVPDLGHLQPDSTLFRWLSPYSTDARLVVWSAEKKTVRQQIQRFQADLRDVRTMLDGRYIIEQYGLRPSPLFGQLLNQLRDARLDGKVETREDEEVLLKRLLAEKNE